MIYRIVLSACTIAVFANCARADFMLSFDHTDFVINPVYNDVLEFNFDIDIDAPLVAGMSYIDPNLNGVDYRILGDVSISPTPSGFNSNFQLLRSLPGNALYAQSDDATLQFSVDAGADLSDGLQISELGASGLVFLLNAREVNQNPGRYHPPIFTLEADGTGRLVNAANVSTFPNPDPPQGSGLIVNVEIAEEYDVNLAFDPNLTIAPPVVPEPASAVMLGLLGAAMMARKPRRSHTRH